MDKLYARYFEDVALEIGVDCNIINTGENTNGIVLEKNQCLFNLIALVSKKILTDKTSSDDDWLGFVKTCQELKIKNQKYEKIVY